VGRVSDLRCLGAALVKPQLVRLERSLESEDPDGELRCRCHQPRSA
jgi:hypothetical protein